MAGAGADVGGGIGGCSLHGRSLTSAHTGWVPSPPAQVVPTDVDGSGYMQQSPELAEPQQHAMCMISLASQESEPAPMATSAFSMLFCKNPTRAQQHNAAAPAPDMPAPPLQPVREDEPQHRPPLPLAPQLVTPLAQLPPRQSCFGHLRRSGGTDPDRSPGTNGVPCNRRAAAGAATTADQPGGRRGRIRRGVSAGPDWRPDSPPMAAQAVVAADAGPAPRPGKLKRKLGRPLIYEGDPESPHLTPEERRKARR